jgi:hypothetical protein
MVVLYTLKVISKFPGCLEDLLDRLLTKNRARLAVKDLVDAGDVQSDVLGDLNLGDHGASSSMGIPRPADEVMFIIARTQEYLTVLLLPRPGLVLLVRNL